MIVACQKILDMNGVELESSTFLTKGKSYPVLSVSIYPGHPMKFRFVSDDGTPVLVEADRFSVEDPSVPESWVTEVKDRVFIESGYPEIVDADIMDRYFEGDDPEALEAVKNAVRQASIDTGIDITSISSYSSLSG